MKLLMLLSFVLVGSLMGGGCDTGKTDGAGGGRPPVITAENACKLPAFIKTPGCKLSAAQICDLEKTCRHDVQAGCFIRADGSPDPACPVLAKCDQRVDELCGVRQ